MSSPPRTFHIIVNPAAGGRKAREFVDEHVAPLLDALHVAYKVHITNAPLHAGEIGVELLNTIQDGEELDVVVAGGDGTAHELIEGVISAGRPIGRWNLVILPLGTANALHASCSAGPSPDLTGHSAADLVRSKSDDVRRQLSSLTYALASSSTPRRLPITITNLVGPSDSSASASSTAGTPAPILSHIVLSTSLHAALLSDSEALRAEHPGIERFKMAAEANLPIAFQADATLHGRVRQYSPAQDAFVEPFTAVAKNGSVELHGPFSYFLSTTTCDRLEPTFIIAPTLTSHPTTEQDSPSMDIIVLRPERDPVVRAAKSEGEKAKARGARLGEAMGWAYNAGAHVLKTWKGGDGDIEERGKGEVVCEVYRCEGFDWIPTEAAHERSHLICADGSIHTIPKGGRASVGLYRQSPTAASTDGFYVWA